MPKIDDPREDTGDPYVYRENEPLSASDYALVSMLFNRHPARVFELILAGLAPQLDSPPGWQRQAAARAFFTAVAGPWFHEAPDINTALERLVLVLGTLVELCQSLQPKELP